MHKDENRHAITKTRPSEARAKHLHSYFGTCEKKQQLLICLPASTNPDRETRLPLIAASARGQGRGKSSSNLEIPCLDAIIRSVYESLCRVINANVVGLLIGS